MEFPPTSICTNLVGFSSKAIDFLRDNNIFIVTNLDGPKKMNDLARIYQGGRQDAPECQECFARKICSVFCKGI
ncbi:hypothetical protein HP931_001058 [Enterococcus faecalis]|uniref:hypothetical protein n=1 Tax=Enterococcus faecalis TaxID=1351 RepID=UPI0019DA20F2|nr:hypothetical protein [Enterococcus faecalis]